MSTVNSIWEEQASTFINETIKRYEGTETTERDLPENKRQLAESAFCDSWRHRSAAGAEMDTSPEGIVYNNTQRMLASMITSLETVQILKGHSTEFRKLLSKVQELMGEDPGPEVDGLLHRSDDTLNPDNPSTCSNLRHAIFRFTKELLAKPVIDSDFDLRKLQAEGPTIDLDADDSDIWGAIID